MINKRTALGQWAVTCALGLTCLGSFYYWDTLTGYARLRLSKWDEETFEGKRLSRLEEALEKQGRHLSGCDISAFEIRTGRTLQDNQRVLRFIKGKPYSWFRIGTCYNMGYVVVGKSSGDEVVIEILRETEIDSL